MVPLADVNGVYTDIVASIFSTMMDGGQGSLAAAAVLLGVVQVLRDARMFGKRGGMPPAILTRQNAGDVVNCVAAIAG